jgi:hypothetical protein
MQKLKIDFIIKGNNLQINIKKINTLKFIHTFLSRYIYNYILKMSNL